MTPEHKELLKDALRNCLAHAIVGAAGGLFAVLIVLLIKYLPQP